MKSYLVMAFLIAAVAVQAAEEKKTMKADPNPRICVQLYVFGEPARKADKPLGDVLSTVKRIGYQQIQAWLDYYSSEESANRLTELLSASGLAMPSAYTGGVMHDPEESKEAIEDILKKAKIGAAHGLKIVILNPNPLDRDKTDAELEIQARNLDSLGAALKELGLQLAIHQHAPEMRSGAREWYHVLHHTDPAKVSFCLDLDWVLKGGQDPYRLLSDAGPRIIDLHLRNSRQGVWAEDFGEGDIDYRKVQEILAGMNYQGYYTVELAHEAKTQVTRSLEENLKLSREYLLILLQ
jgi:inosose dehydratase